MLLSSPKGPLSGGRHRVTQGDISHLQGAGAVSTVPAAPGTMGQLPAWVDVSIFLRIAAGRLQDKLDSVLSGMSGL